MTAAEVAARIDAVVTRWEKCKACSLSKGRGKIAHVDLGSFRGDIDADGPFDPLFVIGDAPGDAADTTGIPWVGAEGELLHNEWLGPSGVGDYVLTNVVGCLSKGSPEFVPKKTCTPRLVELLVAASPRAVLLVGKAAEEWWPRVEKAWGGKAEIAAVVHPSSILRSGYPTHPKAVEKVRTGLGRVRRLVAKAGLLTAVASGHEHVWRLVGVWQADDGRPSMPLRYCDCGQFEKPKIRKVKVAA